MSSRSSRRRRTKQTPTAVDTANVTFFRHRVDTFGDNDWVHDAAVLMLVCFEAYRQQLSVRRELREYIAKSARLAQFKRTRLTCLSPVEAYGDIQEMLLSIIDNDDQAVVSQIVIQREWCAVHLESESKQVVSSNVSPPVSAPLSRNKWAKSWADATE